MESDGHENFPEMESDGVPDEYIDTLVQEFAYDPIRLPVNDDIAQMLYDRRTLETIWDTNHEAVNPYTRQPFHISNVVPQVELRKEMSQYVSENTTLGLEVIADYTKILSARDMENLLKEMRARHVHLCCHCSVAIGCHKVGKLREEKYWKALWKELNLLRLHCQYSVENRKTFSLMNGYNYLFRVTNESLLNLCHQYYSLCDYAKEVCREAARIVNIIGLTDSDLRTVPEESVLAFVHILKDLGQSKYLKIQSMVLRIYRMMFVDDCIWYLINDCNIFSNCNCVVGTVLCLLWRQNTRDITNEDLYNGLAALDAFWIKNPLLVLDYENCVDVVVNVVIICISRLENMHAETAHDVQCGHEQASNIHFISNALIGGLWLIDAMMHSYDYQRERLRSLDIVKEIVRLVDLVLSGFKFMEPSHFGCGLSITMTLYKQYGLSVIRENDVEVFRKFLGSKNVHEYGKMVERQLLDIIGRGDELLIIRRGTRQIEAEH